MDSNTHSTSQSARAGGAGGRAPGAGRPGPRRADRCAPGPSGCVGCGGWPTAWKASGWVSWPRWMPGGRLGPSRASRPARPPAGCGHRLRMGAGAAATAVRTARALFGGPLTATAQALVDGEISPGPRPGAGPRHPATSPTTWPPRLSRCWWRRPGGWTRPGCGGSWPICWLAADPEGADGQAERRHRRRGLWLASTWEGMVAVDGLLEAEAGQIVLAALEPLARPADAHDTRSGDQRRADALVELARRNLEAGQLPQSGGVRPQLLVTVDLDSLLGHPGSLGGEAGAAGAAGPRRRVGGWPATVRSPGSWSPATPPPTTTTTTTTRPRSPRPPGPPGRPGWRGRPDRPAPGGGQAAPPSPWWRPHPTPGGRPHHPGRHGRPTGRPGRARRRLCGRRLPAAPGLVRSPSSASTGSMAAPPTWPIWP